MAFIIKNNSGSPQNVFDLGIRLPNATQRTLSNEFTFQELAYSSDLDALLSAGTLVANNGLADLSYGDAYDYIHYFRLSGDEPVDTLTIEGTGGLDLNSFALKNVPNPVLATDGANKQYIDTQIALIPGSTVPTLTQVLSAGNSAGIYDIDLNFNQINNLGDGLLVSDAVNLGQVQSLVASTSGAETLAQTLAAGNSAGAFSIDMNNNTITNLAAGVLPGDATTLGQVTALVASASGNTTLQTVTNNGNTTTNSITVGGVSTFQSDLHVEGDLYVQGTSFITVTEVITGSQIVGAELIVQGDSYLGNQLTDTTNVSGFLNVGNDAAFSGSVDLQGNSLLNVASGVAPTDGVNLGQVESLIASASGAETLAQILAIGNSAGTFDIDMNANQIVNLADGTLNTDAASWGQVQSLVAATSGDVDTLQSVTDRGAATTNTISVAGLINTGDTVLGSAIATNTVTVSAEMTSYGRTNVDTAAQTYSPLRLVPQVSTPTTQLESGSVMIMDDRLYVYDSVRTKWLSVEKIPLFFGRTGNNLAAQYLRLSDGVPSSLTGYYMPYDGTILGIAMDNRNVFTGTVTLRKNDVLTDIATLTVTGVDKVSDFTLNVDFSSTDQLQGYLDPTVGTARDIQVWAYVCWRK